MSENNGRVEQGRFEGQVLEALGTIKKQMDGHARESSTIRSALVDLQLEVSELKTKQKLIAAGIGGGVAVGWTAIKAFFLGYR